MKAIIKYFDLLDADLLQICQTPTEKICQWAKECSNCKINNAISVNKSGKSLAKTLLESNSFLSFNETKKKRLKIWNTTKE